MNKCMKDLALEAKKRLKGGYWTNYLERRDEDMNVARRAGISEDYVARTYRGRAREEIRCLTGRADPDRLLYDRVKAIVDSDEIVTDPIGRLVDEDRLGAEDVERYILELASAYVRIKRKIEEEREYDKLIGG